jgi:hypothetical protein
VKDGKSKNGKGSKKPKKKVFATKQTFELVQQTFRGEKMKRYFTPQSDIEAQILGLQKVSRRRDTMAEMLTVFRRNPRSNRSSRKSRMYVASRLRWRCCRLRIRQSYLDHSQTQQDQDMPRPTEKTTKRRASTGEEQLPRKKNKISLAPGVDLET